MSLTALGNLDKDQRVVDAMSAVMPPETSSNIEKLIEKADQARNAFADQIRNLPPVSQQIPEGAEAKEQVLGIFKCVLDRISSGYKGVEALQLDRGVAEALLPLCDPLLELNPATKVAAGVNQPETLIALQALGANASEQRAAALANAKSSLERLHALVQQVQQDHQQLAQYATQNNESATATKQACVRICTLDINTLQGLIQLQAERLRQ